MPLSFFKGQDLMTVSEALHIAEDRTGDFFKFSDVQWKRHRYDVKTLSKIRDGGFRSDAFALLRKYSEKSDRFRSMIDIRDYYLICLQDHHILTALGRDRELELLPLLVYIFTHELVHIIRFCNYFQRFEISEGSRDKEEQVVHGMTYDVLRDLSLPRLNYILESYKNHRICDIALS
jgi:hypothetical protein